MGGKKKPAYTSIHIHAYGHNVFVFGIQRFVVDKKKTHAPPPPPRRNCEGKIKGGPTVSKKSRQLKDNKRDGGLFGLFTKQPTRQTKLNGLFVEKPAFFRLDEGANLAHLAQLNRNTKRQLSTKGQF